MVSLLRTLGYRGKDWGTIDARKQKLAVSVLTSLWLQISHLNIFFFISVNAYFCSSFTTNERQFACHSNCVLKDFFSLTTYTQRLVF